MCVRHTIIGRFASIQHNMYLPSLEHKQPTPPFFSHSLLHTFTLPLPSPSLQLPPNPHQPVRRILIIERFQPDQRCQRHSNPRIQPMRNIPPQRPRHNLHKVIRMHEKEKHLKRQFPAKRSAVGVDGEGVAEEEFLGTVHFAKLLVEMWEMAKRVEVPGSLHSSMTKSPSSFSPGPASTSALIKSCTTPRLIKISPSSGPYTFHVLPSLSFARPFTTRITSS
jgi:hypothetical protein